ncbi:hypothetical protein V8E54_009775 [Elaphomyces granulatus]
MDKVSIREGGAAPLYQKARCVLLYSTNDAISSGNAFNSADTLRSEDPCATTKPLPGRTMGMAQDEVLSDAPDMPPCTSLEFIEHIWDGQMQTNSAVALSRWLTFGEQPNQISYDMNADLSVREIIPGEGP